MAPFSGRLGKWGKRFIYGSGAAVGAYIVTDYSTDYSLTRSIRALTGFFTIVYMYKGTTPESTAEYFALHQRAANIILDVCLKNEGLYIKLGQGLNSLSHVLPKEYTNTLKVLLDNAPPVEFNLVRSTVERETGKPLEAIFSEFEPQPVASASIAQVHRARLMPKEGEERGTEVAVKVRKPCITTQGEWDVRTYELIMFAVEKLFGLPTAWSRKSVVDGLRRETDFRIEAENMRHFRKDFEKNRNVYIPEEYSEYNSPALLVLEWVDAVKLADVEAVRKTFDERKVLQTLFNAFGDMVFTNAFVHCDPHGANVLVRERPPREGSQGKKSPEKNQTTKVKDFQVVLLDFGLSVPVTESFRVQYALFFKSFVTQDFKSMQQIVHDWGIGDPETFASLQMQKPVSALRKGNYGEVSREEVRAMQRKAHAKMQSWLKDASKLPKELPLVGRGIDILRGINRLYDSPINRMNMFVKSAVKGLGPIHDYNTAKLYLRRIEDKQDAHRERQYRSVFDTNADLYREEQAKVIQEIEENRTTAEKLNQSVEMLYRMSLFYATLWLLQLTHMWSKYSKYILPKFMQADPNALEDMLEKQVESHVKLE